MYSIYDGNAMKDLKYLLFLIIIIKKAVARYLRAMYTVYCILHREGRWRRFV